MVSSRASYSSPYRRSFSSARTSIGTCTAVRTPPRSRSYSRFGKVFAVLYASPSGPVPSAMTITAVRKKPVALEATVPRAMIALDRSIPPPPVSRSGASTSAIGVLRSVAREVGRLVLVRTPPQDANADAEEEYGKRDARDDECGASVCRGAHHQHPGRPDRPAVRGQQIEVHVGGAV